MSKDTTNSMTEGRPFGLILSFAFPVFLGMLFQQLYSMIDTMIVGKFLGAGALAAVGSSFTLMTFLTSILLGLCMGSGAVFSIRYGRQDEDGLKEGILASFVLIAGITILLNILAFLSLNHIRVLLQVPNEVWGLMREYLIVIFSGITATFLYNYFASFLRAIGNSVVPLVFLAACALLNIVLDLFFVLALKRGVSGAAEATVISQYISGIGIAVYSLFRCSQFCGVLRNCRIRWECLKEIANFSVMTCIQQSVMNLGILMVQGLVNSFGAEIMAAFAAAVKIDAFAYMPVQDFGNAFSTFIAQNYGAGNTKRIQKGLKGAVLVSFLFCIIISSTIWIFARPLMELFVNKNETRIIMEGIRYLHIEGAFYWGIGCLFLLYGLYRAIAVPAMSVVLTIISLGTRVLLAYLLSSVPSIGVAGIWWAIPIGWILADTVGVLYYRKLAWSTLT